MKRLLLTLLVPFWLPAFLLAELRVAAPNSSDRDKARADVVFKGPLIGEELQAAADRAWDDKHELVFSAGDYHVTMTLRTHCRLRCAGKAILRWRGAKGEWMIIHSGVPGRTDPQDIINLRLNGADRAKGVLVKGMHRSTILGLQCYRMVGAGLEIEKGWCIFVRNFTCTYGATPAFKARGFSGSVLDGLSAGGLTGDSPVVDVTGLADLRQLTIENCDTGQSPIIKIDDAKNSRVSGILTERLKGSAVLHVSNSFGAIIERVRCWQEPKSPIPIAVLVTDSEAVRVNSVYAWNVSDSIVKIDAASTEANCRVDIDTIREPYGRKVNVQPRHHVNYAGRGSE